MKQVFIQDIDDGLELGAYDICDLLHMAEYPVDIPEEADVAELVQLIRTDSLYGEALADKTAVRFGRSHRGDRCSGKADLRKRGEHERHMRVATFFTFAQDTGDNGLFAAEVMDTVRVVPIHPEIVCGGPEARYAADRIVGIYAAVWV